MLPTESLLRPPITSAFSSDPQMPQLAEALKIEELQSLMTRVLKTTGDLRLKILSANLVRHKLGKRCLIEYKIEICRDSERELFVFLGKIRAKGLSDTYAIMKELWSAGFDDQSRDGISVPEPLGVIPELDMWLQTKVQGRLATDLLMHNPAGLASKIAIALHKLQGTGISSNRRHGIQDELRILKRGFDSVLSRYPALSRKLADLYSKCVELSSRFRDEFVNGVHRDFYADQILVSGQRIFLLDFDLYAKGHPALDAGNFIGHLKEQSLRLVGSTDALQNQEREFLAAFLQGRTATEEEVGFFTMVTVARHIYLSTQIPGRERFTERLLELSHKCAAMLS